MTRFIVRLLIMAVSLIASVSLPIAAQQGVVSGTVTDPAGRALIGVELVLEGTAFRTVTDRQGTYRLASVPAGTYDLRARFLGHRPFTQPVTVPVGGTVRHDITLQPSPIELEGIVVEGQRLGQAHAINIKKNADNIVNVVSSDFIGRFPDANSAEAIQRLPGVSVARDQGEGRYVLVRGTDARLNSMSINGDRIPSPEGDVRYTALDVIPSDALAAIEVSKTLTPDMEGDAIGGAVNLVTRSALQPQPSLDLGLGLGYNELMGEDINQLSGVFTGRFGPESRLGLVLGGSWYATDRGSDNVEMEWGAEDFGTGDVTVLQTMEFRDYQVFRERISFNGTIDYELTPDSRFMVQGMFNDYSDQEFRRRSVLAFDDGDYDSPTSVSDATIERELKDRLETQRIYNISAGGEHAIGSATLDYRFGFARAEETEPERQDIVFAQEGVGFTYGLANPRNPTYTVTTGNEFDDTAYDFGELVLADNITTDEDFTGGVNLGIPFRLGDAAAARLQLGGKFRLKTKNRTNQTRIYDGFSGSLTLNQVAGTFEDMNFLDVFPNRYRVGRLPDPTGSREFVAANFTDFEFDSDGSREDTDPGNYRADEDVFAGYLMTPVDVGPVRVIPGVRIERTNLSYEGNVIEFDDGGDLQPTVPAAGSNEYTHVLPSVNVRYQLTPNTNVRAAFTTSLARPNYYDLVPYRIINREDEEIEFGNPDLAATTARNLDLIVEQYFQSIGVFSVGAFYKDFSDYIFARTFEISGGSLDGFEATQPQNASGGWLVGTEVEWSQQLSFLPGALNGLGVYGNYTYTNSEITLGGRGDLRLPGQARHLGNAALSYEKYGISARIALNYYGAYINEVGEEPDDDIYLDKHLQFDAAASIRLLRNVRLYGEIVNFTNEPYRVFQGTPDRPIQQEYYSWWSHVGLKIRGF